MSKVLQLTILNGENLVTVQVRGELVHLPYQRLVACM